ncbi:hypothetical protein JCGZ_04312 [Jatropha curcas]|uniref:Uncharacterized protein n=1 Tax=Jatropha curcas TaxID=180498 RepID=A0A067KQH5_JATCU|nr:hypothetical protein JCGZ_04312 [Jatropha curcas]
MVASPFSIRRLIQRRQKAHMEEVRRSTLLLQVVATANGVDRQYCATLGPSRVLRDSGLFSAKQHHQRTPLVEKMKKEGQIAGDCDRWLEIVESKGRGCCRARGRRRKKRGRKKRNQVSF